MSARTRLAQAYYDLATMLDAGLPILRTLDVVIDGRRGPIKQVFRSIRATIAQGSAFAEAMNEHPRVFPDMDRMLIEAAEASGSLPTSFSMLSTWHDFVHRITSRIMAGLVYPCFILHIGAFVAAGPGAILGGFTLAQYLWTVAQFLLVFYIPTAVVLTIMLLQKRVPSLRWPLDFLALRVPILGTALYHMAICRYAKAFSMLYAAGVPITETVERAHRATGNAVVARMFVGAQASIRNGGMAWEGFSKRLPSEYLQLWQVGEESGELDRTVGKIAEIAGDRADLFFQNFARWMPFVVYIAVAIFLATRIFSLFGQVYGNVMNMAQ